MAGIFGNVIRSKRPISAPPAEAIASRLQEIVHPAPLPQVRYFHDLGLRERVLTLPVMVGLGLGLVWRQLGSVSELVRVIHQELVLWVPPLPRPRAYRPRRPSPP